jgi:1-acyl-sn-glycerol-3-phosphate acyltransferase
MAKKFYQDQKCLSIGKIGENLRFELSDFISRTIQKLFLLPSKGLFKFLFQLKIESKEDLSKLKGPLILACTHSSWLDSFLISATFPFKSKVFPIRWGCWYLYYYFPLFFPFLWLLGAFPLRKGIGLERSLAFPVKILKKGGVIGIFPEGKRRHLGRPPKGRRGPAYLALTTNSPILPIKIEGNRGLTIIGSFLRKHKIKIKIGKSFCLPFQNFEKIQDLNKPADLIAQRVRSL